MKKITFLVVIVSIIIIINSVTLPLNNFYLLVEGEEQSIPTSSSINITDLLKVNNKNSNIQLENKTITYFENASGYLVYPTSASYMPTENNNTSSNNKLPAIVMIHEWWGLNDNIKNMANLLAKQGYVVLAVDLFNEVATSPERASELTKAIRDNPDNAISNLKSAVQYLKSLPNVNPDKIASLGWCFGGQQSLQLALNSEENPLAATVIYYGSLVTDPELISKIKWPILGIFGSQDKSIPVDTVNQFEEVLNAKGVPNEIHIYEGVGHAFANPSGDNYAPDETRDAWEKTITFLNKYLG